MKDDSLPTTRSGLKYIMVNLSLYIRYNLTPTHNNQINKQKFLTPPINICEKIQILKYRILNKCLIHILHILQPHWFIYQTFPVKFLFSW